MCRSDANEKTKLDPNENSKPSRQEGQDGEESATSFWNKRPKLVEPTFFIYQLSYFMITSTIDQYISAFLEEQVETYNDNSTESNSTSLDSEEISTMVQAEASRWVLYISLFKTIPSVLPTLLYCSYTDIIGRKFALILPCIGGIIKGVITCFVIAFKANVGYLILGSFFDALTGSHVTMIGVAFSYVVDITDRNNRSFRFTILHGFNIGAIAIANVLVGYSVGGVGYFYTTVIITTSTAIALVWIAVLLPESKTTQTKSKDAFSFKTVLVELSATFKVYTAKRPQQYGRVRLILSAMAFLIMGITSMGAFEVQLLYLLAPPFNFDSVTAGYICMVMNLLGLFEEFVLIKPLLRFLGDTGICIMASLFGICGWGLSAFSVTRVEVIIAYCLTGCSIVQLPIVRSMMTKIINGNEQGALQATVATIETFADMVSSSGLNAIYAATVATFAGGVFLFNCGLFVLLFVIIMTVIYLGKLDEREAEAKPLIEKSDPFVAKGEKELSNFNANH